MSIVVTERAVGRRSVEFSEPRRSRLIPEACRAVGVTHMRSRFPNGGWIVPQQCAPDVEAWLTTRGARIEVTL